MRSATEKDVPNICQYLKHRLSDCVYLYIDIMKYGISQDFLHVWVNEGNAITSIVMKYYDSMQMYAQGTADIDGMACLAVEENVQMISGEKGLIDQLYSTTEIAANYHLKDGYVFQFERYHQFPGSDICKAIPGDAKEIAELICMDEGFAENYHPRVLAEQLRERMISGFGRSLIIREEGKIIAHVATYAELDHIAVTSGLIVHPQYRAYPYGTILESCLVNMLREEGYRVFTFVNDKKRRKLLEALGAEMCGKYAKLTKNI